MAGTPVRMHQMMMFNQTHSVRTMDPPFPFSVPTTAPLLLFVTFVPSPLSFPSALTARFIALFQSKFLVQLSSTQTATGQGERKIKPTALAELGENIQAKSRPYRILCARICTGSLTWY